jgi:glyoxylase-like metal-dependent hydrolase (beta-lactamase superfamily II)
MAITYFCSEEIAEKSWMIKNIGGSTPAICYLVEGSDYALLIDSIIGIGNLKAYCETLTDKPIKVVNTHAHSDHIGGNFHFDHCFLHHRDIGFFQECVGIKKEQVFEMAKSMALEDFREQMVLDDNFADWNPIKIFPVYDGDEFDLGDRKIEVVEVGGHTAGSIVLIDHKTRICYCGDACNSNTLLEFENSLPIITYLRNLLHLKEHQSEFDIMYGGHEVMEPSIVDEAIESVARVVAGTDDKCERMGMMGTPVYYAAAKKPDQYERVDGKRFNMSYVPSRVLVADETKHVYTAKELLREENA